MSALEPLIAADYTAPNNAPRAILLRAALLLGCAALCIPLDPIAADLVRNLQPGGRYALGGDLRREMEFLQQFGAVTSCLICAAAILLLDPGKLRRLADAALSIIATALSVWLLKMLLARPRPRLDDPFHFGGPWTAYEFERGGTTITRYAWEFWKSGTSDLWSVPSNHTAAAWALATVLATMYPPLRVLVYIMAGLVGLFRILFGAHYISDVIVGGALGWSVATIIMNARWASGRLQAGRPSRA
ncbi:MAG: phosphatase PAP2 family protein [Phycisphaeraceae bacterium]|nr:phosphatase PAP2 family protein [Phycisphaeraceae bacterium]